MLDLYAGTGSLGLEALSRGARRAVFVEASRGPLEILGENVRRLGFGARSEIIRGNALSTPSFAEPGSLRFAVVFIDPPFEAMRSPEAAKRVLSRIREALEGPALEPGGCVVVRQPSRGGIEMPFRGAVERRYGRSAVWILEKAAARPEDR